MTWLIMACLLIGAAILQTASPAVRFLGGPKFPLLLSVVLYYGLNRGMGPTIVCAFLAGLLHDALGTTPLGYSGLFFFAAGWITARFRKAVLSESVATPVLFGAASSAAIDLCTYALLVKRGLIVPCGGIALLRALGSGILGGLCAPLVFRAAWALDQAVGNVGMEESSGAIDRI